MNAACQWFRGSSLKPGWSKTHMEVCFPQARAKESHLDTVDVCAGSFGRPPWVNWLIIHCRGSDFIVQGKHTDQGKSRNAIKMDIQTQSKSFGDTGLRKEKGNRNREHRRQRSEVRKDQASNRNTDEETKLNTLWSVVSFLLPVQRRQWEENTPREEGGVQYDERQKRLLWMLARMMDKDRETMMSLFGNTSIEPTNWSSLTVAFGGPSFRWWTSLCFPDPLHQLLTDTHKQMGQNGRPERGWGGYWKGSSGWQVFFLSFLFFFLAGFDLLTSLPRRAGTDPDSRDHITSWWNGVGGDNHSGMIRHSGNRSKQMQWFMTSDRTLEGLVK